MKRILALLLVMLMCVSLVACGNDNATKDDETENQTQSQTNNEKDDNKTNDDYVADPDLPGTLKVNVTTNGTLLKNKLNILKGSRSLRQINISLHSITQNEIFDKEYLHTKKEPEQAICSKMNR